jgi:hypothetical protein
MKTGHTAVLLTALALGGAGAYGVLRTKVFLPSEAEQRLRALTAELTSAEVTAAGLRARVAALEEMLETVPDRVVLERAPAGGAGTAAALRERLGELKLEEVDLLKRYKEESTPVRELREKTAEVEALLAKAGTEKPVERTGVNPVHQALVRELLFARADLARQGGEIDALRSQLATLAPAPDSRTTPRPGYCAPRR